MNEIHGWIFGHRFIGLKFSAMFLVMVPLAKVTPKALGERKNPCCILTNKNSEEFVAKNFAVSESVRELKSMWVHLFESDENPLSLKKISVVLWTPNFGFVSLLKEGMRSIFFICRLGKTFFLFLCDGSFFPSRWNLFWFTLPETNIAPVRRPSPKKTHLPTPVFQVLR